MVEDVLQVLGGEGVVTCDGYHVGWFHPDRTHPIIVAFDRLADKLMVLRAKGKLYAKDCPHNWQMCGCITISAQHRWIENIKWSVFLTGICQGE